MTNNEHVCPICGEEFPPPKGQGWGRSSGTQMVGGWKICGHHQVHVLPSKYSSRCNECLKPIRKGAEVILCVVGKRSNGSALWVALHPRGVCLGSESAHVNETAGKGPWAALYLAPGAPVEVIRGAYKALAMKYHPDRPGGSEDRMKMLNAAMDSLIK